MSFQQLVDVQCTVVLDPFANLALEIVAVQGHQPLSLFIFFVMSQRSKTESQQETVAERLNFACDPLFFFVIFVQYRRKSAFPGFEYYTLDIEATPTQQLYLFFFDLPLEFPQEGNDMFLTVLLV